MITEKQNVLNMERCPRFISCNCAVCPFDAFRDMRTELDDDELCPLRVKLDHIRKTKKVKERIVGRCGNLMTKYNEFKSIKNISTL
jgi:hypothetical protein